MPIDAHLLEEAKRAEARFIDAEHAAEVARADFHHAVRRLQLAGASLREIASALNVSHQRVHQIVEGAGGSRRFRRRQAGEELMSCAFCGKSRQQVRQLIAGPHAYICNECVVTASGVITSGETAAAAHIERVSEDARTERCSFCGKRRHRVSGMVSSRTALPLPASKGTQGMPRICSECLALCHEILNEELS